jgi:hypothetical protein
MNLDSTGTFQQQDEKVVEASYEISYLIAKDRNVYS